MRKPTKKQIREGMAMARKLSHDALDLCPVEKRAQCAWCPKPKKRRKGWTGKSMSMLFKKKPQDPTAYNSKRCRDRKMIND